VDVANPTPPLVRSDLFHEDSLPRPVWFEAYRESGGTWYPGNVLGRALRGEDFSAWYTEGDATVHGVIPPGSTAVCDVNWYGSNSPEIVRSKWAFIAVD